jgi:hypothetical protein
MLHSFRELSYPMIDRKNSENITVLRCILETLIRGINMGAIRPSGLLAVIVSLALLVQPGRSQVQGQSAGAPKKLNIVIVEGEGAINNVRQRLVREPVVQVEDENRKPVAGAAVTFLLPNQGAGATFPNGARSLTVVTDQNGQAAARGLQANNVGGDWQIRVNASYEGDTATTTISQTNAIAAAAAAGGISGKLIAILAVAGAAIAGGAIAATRNGNDNGTQTRPPSVVVPGTPSVGGPQ